VTTKLEERAKIMREEDVATLGMGPVRMYILVGRRVNRKYLLFFLDIYLSKNGL
jgi:hypothetical protein